MRNLIVTFAIVSSTFAVQNAFASLIVGDIAFSGFAVLDSAIPSATKFVSFNSITVGNDTQTGDYVGTDGSPVTSTPFTFLSSGHPTSESAPFTLWTFLFDSKVYSCTAQTVDKVIPSVINAAEHLYTLDMSGTGTVAITGKDATPAAWSLSIAGKRSTLTFATYAPSVPESTAFALISSLSLVGFGLWRRRNG